MAPDRFHQLFAAIDVGPQFAHEVASLSLATIIMITVADILQSSPSLPTGVDVQHVTLDGVLVAAVVVLWRALTAERDHGKDSEKAVTTALALSAASNAELRKIIEDSVKAKQDLTESQHALTGSIDRLRARLDNGK